MPQLTLPKILMFAGALGLVIALANFMAPVGVKYLERGDSLSITLDSAEWKIHEGWVPIESAVVVYHIEVDELTDDSLRIIVTRYSSQKVVDIDSGPFTIPEGPTPKEFYHFKFYVDDVCPQEARVTIKQIIR